MLRHLPVPDPLCYQGLLALSQCQSQCTGMYTLECTQEYQVTTGHLLCGLGVADQEWPLVLAAASLKEVCIAFQTIAYTSFTTACVHMQRA